MANVLRSKANSPSPNTKQMVAVSMPEEMRPIWTELRALATQMNVTISSLVFQAFVEYLERHREEGS